MKEDESFHGFKPETIDSLLLSVMPVDNYTFKPGPITPTFMDSSNVLMKIIQSIQYVLQNWAGFQFLSVSIVIIIIGTVSAKTAPRLKCYKNVSRLKRYNVRTDIAMDFLFSTLHSEMV